MEQQDISKLSDAEILARYKKQQESKAVESDPEQMPLLAQPDSLAAQESQEPQPDQGMLERFSSGAATGESPGVFSSEFLGANIGPIAGGVIGMAGGPVGSAVGAGAGRAVQNAIQAGMQTRDISPLQAVGEPALEGALQFTGEKVIAPVAQAGIAAAGKVATPILGGLSGVGQEVMDNVFKRPAQALARRGEGFLDEAVDTAREAFEGFMGTAGKKYEEAIEAVVKGNKYADQEFPIAERLADVIGDVRKKYGFGIPGRKGPEVKLQDAFAEWANHIRTKSAASIEDVYWLQRDMGQAIRANKGVDGINPFGSALSEVRDVLMRFIGESVEEIGKANKAFAKLKPMEKFAKTLANKQNLESTLKQISKNPRLLTSKKFKALAKAYPDAQQALQEVIDSVAGKAIDPIFSELPRTGFTGALLKNVMTPALPFLSPRVSGRVIAEAGKMGGRMENRAVGRVGGQVAGMAGNTLEDIARKFLERKKQK